MSSPHDFLEAGRLADAIESQVQAVKGHPTDSDERFMLFVLLCFAGDLERAQIHLESLVRVESETKGGASVYQALLASEYERQRVFAGNGSPSIPPGPEGNTPGVQDRLEAVLALHEGDSAKAKTAIDRANEAAVELSGKINDQGFDSICDYDDLLGDIVEVYAGGRYIWIPLQGLRSVSIQEPKHQLDLLWAPAEIESIGGETSSVHLPVLYPGSAASADGLLQLGRSTEWQPIEDDLFRGIGQKVFFATKGDQEIDVPLLETRTLELVATDAADAG